MQSYIKIDDKSFKRITPQLPLEENFTVEQIKLNIVMFEDRIEMFKASIARMKVLLEEAKKIGVKID